MEKCLWERKVTFPFPRKERKEKSNFFGFKRKKEKRKVFQRKVKSEKDNFSLKGQVTFLLTDRLLFSGGKGYFSLKGKITFLQWNSTEFLPKIRTSSPRHPTLQSNCFKLRNNFQMKSTLFERDFAGLNQFYISSNFYTVTLLITILKCFSFSNLVLESSNQSVEMGDKKYQCTYFSKIVTLQSLQISR